MIQMGKEDVVAKPSLSILLQGITWGDHPGQFSPTWQDICWPIICPTYSDLTWVGGSTRGRGGTWSRRVPQTEPIRWCPLQIGNCNDWNYKYRFWPPDKTYKGVLVIFLTNFKNEHNCTNRFMKLKLVRAPNVRWLPPKLVSRRSHNVESVNF